MKTSVCAIVCAAGTGSRAGFSKNKLLVGQGKTILEKTLDAFDFPSIDEIVVTASATDKTEIEALCAPYSRTRVVLGGDTRSQSVFNALKAATSDIVLIHDGARPFVTRDVIEGCIRSVQTYGSGICAVECRDTIAQTQEGKIVRVPDRNTLRMIQTPQGFFRENIVYAYERAFATNERTYTDDSSVFAAFCGAPTLCDGDVENKKLTYAADFQNDTTRCGFGIDTHAFGKPQDYIVLAGVKIPSASGLVAHSDGDVLVHAVMDAILSAAGCKDIGHYFPDTDDKWKDADSMQMLRKVLNIVGENGYRVRNISIAIQAERPRLSPYIDEMKTNLADVLRIDPTAVGITAGTNEGLGYVGEGKGITVHAYTLLYKENF